MRKQKRAIVKKKYFTMMNHRKLMKIFYTMIQKEQQLEIRKLG